MDVYVYSKSSVYSWTPVRILVVCVGVFKCVSVRCVMRSFGGISCRTS